MLAMSQTRLLAGLLGECHDSALAQLCGKQKKSNMPNAPFRKYQTSGFAFEAYSFAIHNAEKGVLTTLNNTQLNLNLIITKKWILTLIWRLDIRKGIRHLPNSS